MRTWKSLQLELREIAWLASIVSGLSIVGVGLAVAAVMVLDVWMSASIVLRHI